MSGLRVVSQIAATNLRRLGRDRLGLFFIVILPFLIILLFGVAGGGGGVTVLGVAGTAADDATRRMLDHLRADTRVELDEHDDRASLEEAVRRGRVDAGLVVGPDAGALELLADPAGDPRAGSVVQEAVSRVDAVLRPALVAGEAAGVPTAELVPVAERMEPPVEVTARLAVADVAEWDGAQRGAAANLVLFIFITSLVGSAALIETRELGLTRRMLAGPTTSRTVLLGEGVGRYAIAALQGVVIVVGSMLLFGVDWVDPVGVVVIIALLSLVATGAAMLMGAVFSNAEQASGVAVPLGIGLGMLGGTMWPLEITPPVMQVIGRLTPHAWAMDALDGVLSGTGLPAVPLLVLAGMGAVLLVLAGRLLGRRIHAGR